MRYALALLALLLAPAAASAEVVLGLELSGNADPFSETVADGEVGAGIDGRLGVRMPTDGLQLEPEFVFGWHAFAERRLELAGVQSHSAWRGLVGGRLGAGEILRPSFFAHVGAAWYEPSYLMPTFGGDVEVRPRQGAELVPAMDLGIALDLAAIPLLDIGVHATYNRLLLDDALDWIGLGAHVALVLP